MQKPELAWTETWLPGPKTSFIDGRFVPPDGTPFTSTDPATGRALATLHLATPAQVDAAVSAARRVFEGPWRTATRRARIELMRRMGEVARRHRAELATLEALANGKLYREAYDDDLPDSADLFDYYAGWVDKLHGETCPVEQGFLNYTVREPVGVCALIVPWNFPLLLAMWKIAPALAMGNAVVVKPAPFTSLSILRWIELCQEEAELPPGLVNIVLGEREVGEALTHHPRVDKVSFTGSTATGRRVVQGAAASNLKAVTLELGGKSPSIVFEDAPDVPFAIRRSFDAMFSHKGEKCSEPTRLLVQDRLYDRFLAELAPLCEAVVCGPQFDERSTQGAQCHQAQLDKILRYIELGKSSGARLVAGGERDVRGANARGLFVRPTIFADVDQSLPIAQEEIFGPVLVVTRFSDEDEAVRLANSTIYGLAAGLWTRDISRAHRVAARLDAGQIFINRYGCYDFASPFGGFRQSGWGKEMAMHSLSSYTKTKSIWVAL
jgi:aldehyde dehydrogenase (NAD+)